MSDRLKGQRQGRWLQEVVEILEGSDTRFAHNVWIASNYSKGALIRDLKAVLQRMHS